MGNNTNSVAAKPDSKKSRAWLSVPKITLKVQYVTNKSQRLKARLITERDISDHNKRGSK
jgi:hypothetical protein